MGLAADLEALTQKSAEARCRVCRWLTGLTSDELEAFNRYLTLIRSGKGQFKLLLGVCATHGLVAGDRAFRDHCHQHHDDLMKRLAENG